MLRTFAAVTDDSIVDFMRLLTKTPPTSTGNLTASIEAFNENVLESDDPFMHRFQHSTIAESVLLLTTQHNTQIQKEKDSASDMRSVTAFPDTLVKVLGCVNLLSPDSEVHDALDSDSINHATMLAYVGDTLKALEGLEVERTEGVDTIKANVKVTLKKIDALFLVTGLRVIENWAEEIVTELREIGSTGNEEHRGRLQILIRNLKQFVSLPKMRELLVPVVGQQQAVMSGNKTLNFLIEFENFVTAIVAVADATDSNSVVSPKMIETMTEHIDGKQPETLVNVSNMFVSYRCLLFAGTGLTEVDRAKVQMKAMLPKLESKAPRVVQIMKSMEDAVLPAVSNSLQSVEASWKAGMTTPIEKEKWEEVVGRPSVEGQDDFKSYEDDLDYMHLKKVCVLTYDAGSMASLDVTKAVAAFASDLSRLSRKVSSLDSIVAATLQSTGGQQIHIDAVVESLLEPFSKMIAELGDIESDYCRSSKRFVMMKNLHPDKAVEFKMAHGTEVAGRFMNETANKTLAPLALLSDCLKKAVPSNWEQVLSSRSEQLIWSTIKAGPGEVHDKSCDCIAIIGEASDIFVRMGSAAAGGTMPATPDITAFSALATSMRKYTASVMAADRIFSQIQTLKTKSSRNDNYRACPCLLFRCCLFVFAVCRPLRLLSVARLVMSQAQNRLVMPARHCCFESFDAAAVLVPAPVPVCLLCVCALFIVCLCSSYGSA